MPDENKKSPQLRELRCDLMLSGASLYWTWNHFHSIVNEPEKSSTGTGFEGA